MNLCSLCSSTWTTTELMRWVWKALDTAEGTDNSGLGSQCYGIPLGLEKALNSTRWVCPEKTCRQRGAIPSYQPCQCRWWGLDDGGCGSVRVRFEKRRVKRWWGSPYSTLSKSRGGGLKDRAGIDNTPGCPSYRTH